MPQLHSLPRSNRHAVSPANSEDSVCCNKFAQGENVCWTDLHLALAYMGGMKVLHM